MSYRNFDALMDVIKLRKEKVPCAVVEADSEYALKAALQARRDDIVEPVLIGNASAIRECLEKIGETGRKIRIIATADPEESAQRAAELVKSGEVDILVKGHIESSLFFSPLLDKQNGLQPKKILSGFTVFEIPTYHKLIAATDGGITLYPNLEQKKMLVENAVAALRRMGIACPKVAVLAALETPSPKMPETMDAAALKKMNETGDIQNCIIEGPISYDLAIDKESVRIKGFDSPVAGDADLLVTPNITTGNLLNKSLYCSADAKIAPFAIGAKPTIIFGSRASTENDAYRSLVIATALGGMH